MEWLAPIAGAFIAGAFGFASVYLGHRTRRRLGLPGPVDEQIAETERRLRDSLAAAEERCRLDLDEARADLVEERRLVEEERSARVSLQRQHDELQEQFVDQQLYVRRLEARLNKVEAQQEHPGS